MASCRGNSPGASGPAWQLAGAATALSVYDGMTFMIIAVRCLPVSQQLLAALAAGIAAGIGALAAGSLVLLLRP